MKKTVFDLDYKEGRKIDKQLRKTSYYKQYSLQYIIGIIVLFICVMSVLSDVMLSSSIDSNTKDIVWCVSVIILLCFVALISIIFGIKRFNLVKQYYDEKYANKKGEEINE